MKIIFFIVFLVTFQFHCLGQTAKIFDIKEIITTDTLHKKTAIDFQRETPGFFEDDKYLVRKTCSGEWGGAIWFKNKKTGIERSCSATCPIIVNKLDGKYIVTATLNHLSGFSQVLEIDNPEKLTIFKLPKPKVINGKTLVRYVGDDESRSTKGSITLVDTPRISTLVSFPLNDKLYHIITDYKKTYVATIENKKFVMIDTLSQKSFWSYTSDVIKTKNGHLIVLFKNEDVNGYLDVFGHEINIIRYK